MAHQFVETSLAFLSDGWARTNDVKVGGFDSMQPCNPAAV
jgi:hypothetical protein